MERDQLPLLEAALSDTWSWVRAAARSGAQAMHPQLDPTAYPLVSLLGRRAAMRPSELSTALHLDRSTVSRQIDAAERLGLVERVPDPDDARARSVRLTPVGQERMAALRAERLVRWRAGFADWEPAEIAELTRLLRRLNEVDLS